MDLETKATNENLYYKIKVEFLHAKKRFYRVFLVRSGVWLFSLIEAIRVSLKASDEHLYDLTPKGRYIFGSYKHGKRVDDLPQKTYFTYDFGDEYKFVITKFKATKELAETKDFLVLNAKGQGIWEDFIREFYEYLSGYYTDEDYANRNEEDVNPLPEDYEKPSDFDKPIDLKEMEERINNIRSGWEETYE